MRITGGEFKNRTLFTPEGKDVRPTSDRMRQTVFNLLSHAAWAVDFDLNGARLLDIFCGTGALGLEALSRGGAHCLFIDQDIYAVQRNTAFLDNSRYRVVKANALRFGKGEKDINLVFMDPPYGMNLVEPAIRNLIDQQWLSDGAIIIVETESDINLNLSLEILDLRRQGNSTLRVFKYNN